MCYLDNLNICLAKLVTVLSKKTDIALTFLCIQEAAQRQ